MNVRQRRAVVRQVYATLYDALLAEPSGDPATRQEMQTTVTAMAAVVAGYLEVQP